MTKKDIEKIVEEEGLATAYNWLEDRPDAENEVVAKQEKDHFVIYRTDENAQVMNGLKRLISEEDALDMFLAMLRSIRTKQYEKYFENMGAKRVLRKLIEKKFVSMHDFEALYHELYKTEAGKCFSVIRKDPAPGGYGEEWMYIMEAYESDVDDQEKAYSDEELLQFVFAEGDRLRLVDSSN